MAYATLADMEATFGAKELVMLADRNRDGVADVAVVDRALEDAEAEVNSYLATRYVLPLDPVPAQIRAITCDVARYRLDAMNPRAITQERYDRALKSLADISKGVAALGAAGLAAAEVASPPAMVSYDEATSVFSNERLLGF